MYQPPAGTNQEEEMDTEKEEETADSVPVTPQEGPSSMDEDLSKDLNQEWATVGMRRKVQTNASYVADASSPVIVKSSARNHKRALTASGGDSGKNPEKKTHRTK